MREIKFRAKRLDNNEWVYGYYYSFYFDNNGKHFHKILDKTTQNTHEVNEETLGQFTGLLDKNGKEIYEGDIVRDRWNSYTPIYENAIYMAYNAEKINDLYVSTQFNIIWRNGCEVIGNIPDKKELLEVTNA